MGFGGKCFCIKSDKARIATRQNTVNQDIENVEGTCGRAYIVWIKDAANSDCYECKIGIFLLGSDLTHNYGVENFSSSVSSDIFKSNDVEGVCAFY